MPIVFTLRMQFAHGTVYGQLSYQCTASSRTSVWPALVRTGALQMSPPAAPSPPLL
jgi:hypothetical protein